MVLSSMGFQPRRFRSAALLITSPLALISACAWVDALNPMASTFDDSFIVRNHSQSTAWVTPPGHPPDDATRRVVSQHMQVAGRLTFPALRDHHRLQPGEQAMLAYDADDLVLSELLIETSTLPTPAALRAGTTSARGATFTISDLKSLPTATRAERDGARRGGTWISWGSLFAL